MKLNYKRTLLVGFAFFLISAFWQAYEAIVPLMLTNKFGLDQGASGIIMSLDNILALFMLPIFGALSDKKDTRFGKRTPFIVMGAISAVICFIGLTVVDNAQLKKIGTSRDYLWESQMSQTVEYKENDLTDKNSPKDIVLKDYAARLYFNKDYSDLSADEQAQLKAWFVDEDKLNYDTVYTYNRQTNTYKLYQKTEKGGIVDMDGNIKTDKSRTYNAYVSIVSSAKSLHSNSITQQNIFVLVLFIVLLLAVLISMATFRSPAVALMPDVTIKPLRSKANAIINLMGTAGGILVLLLGMLFGTGKVINQQMSYTYYVIAVCGIMITALVIFMMTVKEKRWNKEMLEQQAILDEQEEQQEAAPTEVVAPTTEKIPKDKLRSLLFILASVALWFIGYNAVTSKYSVYAVNVLDKDYNTTLLIAQAAAVVAYIPVGIVASKLGRKKTILAGIIMLTTAFTGAIFIDSSSPSWLISVLFALAGVAWATINVNSFPMVVELAKGSNTGKYTGYYYTASMSAQIVTPILSGYLMTGLGTMKILFPYAAIFVALSFVTMLFVKHGDSRPEQVKDKMELLAGADD